MPVFSLRPERAEGPTPLPQIPTNNYFYHQTKPNHPPMRKILFLLAATLLLSTTMCRHSDETTPSPAGKLVIIGGGAKPDIILNTMVDLAGITTNGYLFVLPMASSLPDSAIIWAKEDFAKIGLTRVTGYSFISGEPMPTEKLDSLRNAKLIFISGGDQSRFMDAVNGTPALEALKEAFANGAVIAGTSAGAAVMGRKMITGNQLRYPDADPLSPGRQVQAALAIIRTNPSLLHRRRERHAVLLQADAQC
jgi:cyanophycinase